MSTRLMGRWPKADQVEGESAKCQSRRRGKGQMPAKEKRREPNADQGEGERA